MSGSRVALVADDRPLAEAIQTWCRESLRLNPLSETYAGIRELLDTESDGLLIIAVSGGADGQEALRLVQDVHLQKFPPLLVIADRCGPESPLRALDSYVARRLRWPEEASQLEHLIQQAGRGREFRSPRNDSLEDLLNRKLLSWTPSLLPLADQIALAASHDVTVLLTGETGTGKTYLARLLHEHSPRKREKFMAVPCGAVAANLIESEFFGHVKGAFTGADRPKLGKFAAVGQGSLLLDEIDTLPLEQQAALLRVIETGEYEPVGSVETQKSQARLVFAANVDLEEACRTGRFRSDLYFRLNVMSFHLPPLRERIQDIAPLARGMAARFARKFNKDLFDIHPDAMAALEAYHWPGNLRQLENVIQHAVLVSIGPQLMLRHLPVNVQEQPLAPMSPALAAEPAFDADTLHRHRDQTERMVIQRALISNGYSRTRAADSLGISRVTLYKKMKKYGLMTGNQPVPAK